MCFLELCMDSDLIDGQSVGNWTMDFAPNVFGDKKDNLQLMFRAYSDEGRENCVIEEELMISRKSAIYLRNYLNSFLEDCKEKRERNRY